LITEILQLGIKGSDLVLRQLKQIQEIKKRVAQISNVRMAISTTKGVTGQELAENRPLSYTEPTKPPPKPDDKDSGKDKSEKRDYAKEFRQSANQAFQGAASLDTGALLAGLGNALNLVSFGVSGVLATMGQAALTFKDKIKAAAQGYADTKDALNTAANYAGDEQFLRGGDKTPFKSRGDISTNEQRGIIEALGSQYGKFSLEFKDAVRTLYGTRDNPYDVKQTTAIAQGNFEALGTDQGFFMQKIANSLQNLPPSAKKELMPQLWTMIPDADRFKQNDAGIRATNTEFDDLNRQRESRLLYGESGKDMKRISNAKAIQETQNEIDQGLADAAGSLITALRDLSKKLRSVEFADFVKSPSASGARRLID